MSQVVTLGSAALLWFTRETWMGPLGGLLAKVGPAFADNFFLRDMASSLLLFGGLLLTAWVVEKKIVEKSGPLRFSNHWGGALLGLAKGLLYGTVLLWTTQTWALWKQAPDESAPAWVADSIAIDLVGPWNPIRMFTLRELVDEMKLRAEKSRSEEADEEETQKEDDEANRAQSPRDRALRRSSSLKDLVDAVRNDPDWASASYRRLLEDPRVQQIIDDPELGEMLFGN